MSISLVQQLEAFAFWRRQLLAAPQGQALWGLEATTEAKLMNQAPLYALGGQRVDFYVEVPLLGQPQVDVSAQYFAEAFAEGNPLQDGPLSQEGAFFHYYAKELAKLKPMLLNHCNLYLEADIDDAASSHEQAEGKNVATFINLSGDFVDELLLAVLGYRGRLRQAGVLQELLEKLKEWCEPWHFGFMESRAAAPLRLVLFLKQGLHNLEQALTKINAPQIPQAGWELLQKIDALGIFKYMLDVDVLDDQMGDTLGVELIPQDAIYPAVQQRLVQTEKFAALMELLQQYNVADARIDGLKKTIFAASMDADTYIYSRISHFKLRWQRGEALPAKAYVQLRPVQRQSCLNEALGYVKRTVIREEGSQHE